MNKINDLKKLGKEKCLSIISDLIDDNYQEKIIHDSYCYLSIGDVSTKESLILKAILKSFNIKYYTLEEITDSDLNNQDLFIVISKIINYGIKNIILDIKIDNEILAETVKEVSQIIVSIGKEYGLGITCFGTNSKLSIGTSFGKNLELQEISDILNGNTDYSFALLSVKFASYIISNIKNISLEDANQLVLKNIENKKCYNTLKEIIDLDNLNLSNKIFSIKSSKTGFIKNIVADEIKDLLLKIGFDDSSVGIKFTKQIGDYVLENEQLALVYLNKKDILTSEVLDCFEIEDKTGDIKSLVQLIVR